MIGGHGEVQRNFLTMKETAQKLETFPLNCFESFTAMPRLMKYTIDNKGQRQKILFDLKRGTLC